MEASITLVSLSLSLSYVTPVTSLHKAKVRLDPLVMLNYNSCGDNVNRDTW